MKTKRILTVIVCLLAILGGLNYLLQQSPMPIGTPGSTPAAGAAQFVGKHGRNLPLRSKSLIIPVVLPLQIW